MAVEERMSVSPTSQSQSLLSPVGTPASGSPSSPNAGPKKIHYNSFGPYKLGKTIGQGEFGKVKLGYHVQSGNEVAIKLIKKESIQAANRKQKLVREIEILQSVNHRNIVKLWEVIETDNYIGMVMNYAAGGELFDHILTRRYLRDSEACRIFSQLILGVSHLHALGIVHRDLKLENLLLDSNRNLIITDFGFANRFNAKENDLLSTSCGSACYAAPELVINDCYAAEGADIWSCGVILYAMVCGYLPYDDDQTNPQGENINQLYKYIMETKLIFPSHVSGDVQNLILRILVTDPTKRAKMREIQLHKWLSGYRHQFQAQETGLVRSGSTKRAESPTLSPTKSSSTTSSRSKRGKSPGSKIQRKESPRSFHYNSESDSNSASFTPPHIELLPSSSSTSSSNRPTRKMQQQHQMMDSASVPTVVESVESKRYSAAPRKSADAPSSSRPVFEEEKGRAHSMDQSRRPINYDNNLDEEYSKMVISNQTCSSSTNTTILDYHSKSYNSLRLHSGPIDQRALSSLPPNRVLNRILGVLEEMKLDAFIDPTDPFKIKVLSKPNNNRSKKNGNILNFPAHLVQRLKYIGKFGLQYNRGFTGTPVSIPQIEPSQKTNLSPIKMNVMIHRIKNLDGLVTVDVKRKGGDIWEFKRMYEEIIQKLGLRFS